MTYNRWTEEIEHEDHHYEDGVKIDDSWTEYVYHLDVNLTSKSFEQYIEENKATLFEKDQEQQFITLNEVGGMNLRQELGSPFIGIEWKGLVTSRYGYRVHPIDKDKSFHTGIDISVAGGTPINAVMSGKVIQVSFDADGYGNYLIIEEGSRRTLYAHCRSISAVNGSQVNKGDVIALVGTTGKSTGDHLHIEFEKDGERLNPAFYLSDK